MTAGRFIVIEGIDGAGKTTQANLLGQALATAGVRMQLTREPSDGTIGTLIRGILAGDGHVDEQTLALLYAADRLDHVTRPGDGIVAALADGIVVISDRYCLSSFAYHAHVASSDWIEAINAAALRAALPDLTVFLEVSPEVAFLRLRGRSHRDRYEHNEMIRVVHAAYARALQRHGERHHVVLVPGEGAIEAVHASVMASVRARL